MSANHGVWGYFSVFSTHPWLLITSQHFVLIFSDFFTSENEIAALELFADFPDVLVSLVLDLSNEDWLSIWLKATPNCITRRFAISAC